MKPVLLFFSHKWNLLAKKLEDHAVWISFFFFFFVGSLLVHISFIDLSVMII